MTSIVHIRSALENSTLNTNLQEPDVDDGIQCFAKFPKADLRMPLQEVPRSIPKRDTIPGGTMNL